MMNRYVIHKECETGTPGEVPKLTFHAKCVEDAADFSNRLKRFVEQEDRHCPFCGTLAEQCTKKGLLAPVVIQPCGCELWKGSVPPVWNGGEVARPIQVEAEKESETPEVSERIQRFANREDIHCPHCGAEARACRKQRKVVYVIPCGCKLWKGPVPEAWR